MKSVSEFYGSLHAREKEYSAGTYDMSALFSCGPWTSWMNSKQGKRISILDVGCGKGLFLKQLVTALQHKWNVTPERLTGVDLILSPGNLHQEISENFEFIEMNTDGNPLPFNDQSFDLITCNHVLEHVFETENLVSEFRRVIKPEGLCIISVPNLAAWVNRIGLLFASQPLGTEVGAKSITYGFWPRHFQNHLAKFPPSGHIRDFTPRSLMDLTKACGFRTVGWWKQSFGVAARLSKWGGRNIAIVLQPP